MDGGAVGGGPERIGAGRAERPGAGGRVFHLPLEPIPISSSDVRRRARRGDGLDGLVPPSVAGYIQSSGIYRVEESR